MSTIEERVKKIVVEQLGVKEEEATNNASFVHVLAAQLRGPVRLAGHRDASAAAGMQPVTTRHRGVPS